MQAESDLQHPNRRPMVVDRGPRAWLLGLPAGSGLEVDGRFVLARIWNHRLVDDVWNCRRRFGYQANVGTRAGMREISGYPTQDMIEEFRQTGIVSKAIF